MAAYNLNSESVSESIKKRIIYTPSVRDRSYEERFYNDVIKKCGDWGNETLENVHNYFVNGHYDCSSPNTIKNMTIIGNISESANITANKLVIVAPNVSDKFVMSICKREAQREWKNIYLLPSEGDNKIKDSSRSMILLKTFSICLNYMKDMDNDKFVNTCKKIIECSQK